MAVSLLLIDHFDGTPLNGVVHHLPQTNVNVRHCAHVPLAQTHRCFRGQRCRNEFRPDNGQFQTRLECHIFCRSDVVRPLKIQTWRFHCLSNDNLRWTYQRTPSRERPCCGDNWRNDNTSANEVHWCIRSLCHRTGSAHVLRSFCSICVLFENVVYFPIPIASILFQQSFGLGFTKRGNFIQRCKEVIFVHA